MLVLGLSTLLYSCKKFISIDPPKTALVSVSVFSDDATATAAITGIYNRMMEANDQASGLSQNISTFGALSADEFISFSTTADLNEFYGNAISKTNGYLTYNLWGNLYSYIYSANAIIEGLSTSKTVSEAVKKQLTGESKFIRAFCHFYLVNLFGDIPLITTTNYQLTAKTGRSSPTLVYGQIIADLKEAESMLAPDYTYSKGERTRPNQWAASAMLARVYLYTGDWANAEAESGKLIGNTTMFSLLTDLNAVFLMNSQETILQLMPVSPGFNTMEGYNYILTTAPSIASLTDQLLNSFEPGDYRRDNWIDSVTVDSQTYYYPFKYKVMGGDPSAPVTEYAMFLRLAEQFLIRAEARAMQNNIAGAQDDLNAIRSRAGLSSTTAIDQAGLLLALEQERKVELFTEWGNRWLDLKRLGRADIILGPQKPGWKATAALYPIPLYEIQNNPQLSQNPGY